MNQRGTRTVIVVTPSPRDKGGIASVVNALMGSTLPSRYAIRVVSTVSGSGIMRHLRGWGGVARACGLIASTPGAIVHVHMSYGMSFWRKAVVVFAARVFRRPSIVHLHGSRFHSWVASGGPVRRVGVRSTFRGCTMVVVLSESWARRVEAFSGRRDCVVLPNPVAIPDSPTSGADSRCVVFSGRLGERKGVYELVDAIRLLQTDGVDAHWLLAGDGDIDTVRAAVRELPVPSLVEVPGWLDHGELVLRIGSSQVFCLPSTDEGVPIAMLEAMAAGLVCVVTPVGGIPEVIVDGENGLLVPPRDSTALAQALRMALDEPELARMLGSRARSTVEKRYAVERVADRVDELYKQISSVESHRRA